ncbi:uncharacterized protein KGF55_003606 [Candida pseudojiufengensis]|uniref:uncharacterized protein n=1 Tax=Candida pseudojiufengensis TaxID=497109 RepID=UPI00222430D7|nr:uncharacterized protein KGF55_003606 [Candida pseudojiufengensis]KAI5962530.1 hypothetical protein KGF55_003606 [Candida pseudojiufengensis]
MVMKNALKELNGTPSTFSTGQWVCKRRQKGKRAQPNLAGPFQVIEVGNKGSYKLNDGTKASGGTCHHDDWKLAYALDDRPIQVFNRYENSLKKAEQRLCSTD